MLCKIIEIVCSVVSASSTVSMLLNCMFTEPVLTEKSSAQETLETVETFYQSSVI